MSVQEGRVTTEQLAFEVQSMMVAQLRCLNFPTSENIEEAKRREQNIRELCARLLRSRVM